jgi:hypothetical protein
MKATVASFAAVLLLCGQAIGQEAMPPAPGPEQGAPPPMMDRRGGAPPRMGLGMGPRWWKDPAIVATNKFRESRRLLRITRSRRSTCAPA